MEQVIVVGGGPVGLWLAAELRLGGTSVTLLEAREEIDPHSKALTVHPRTVEILAFRGAAGPFLDEGAPIPSGHFGGLETRMDFSVLDTPFPYTLALPQARTEELLERHATAAGARIRRGHRVRDLTQDADGVTVQVDGPDGAYPLKAAYVVGCDGTRSTVREAAGIDFPGTDTSAWGWLGDVILDDPPPVPALQTSDARGGMMMVKMPGGVHRFVGIMPEDLRPDWPGELTLEELRAKVTRLAGTDFGMRDPQWLSRFGNASRQAAQYRKGRVLLAGDAAHRHFPAGGVGMNVGIQDATNLGWKLASTVHGGPDDLLDSYHAERHPVGEELLLSTQAQTALMTAYSHGGQALRAMLGGLIATVPELSKTLAERLAGLSVAYPPGTPTAHPLVGRRAPDLTFTGSDTSLFDLLHHGRHVLLNLTDEPMPAAPAGVVTHDGPPAEPRPEWDGVRAALIRPDGHVAWATERPGEAPPIVADGRTARAAD